MFTQSDYTYFPSPPPEYFLIRRWDKSKLWTVKTSIFKNDICGIWLGGRPARLFRGPGLDHVMIYFTHESLRTSGGLGTRRTQIHCRTGSGNIVCDLFNMWVNGRLVLMKISLKGKSGMQLIMVSTTGGFSRGVIVHSKPLISATINNRSH